ncbi:MAG: UDP-N-acetylmuramate dehydrogenase [Gammaproteobacteria bacterium]|nr:UDP-N-acetylmuramate dehydrogenase [Gammaproteobacteria bacterium]
MTPATSKLRGVLRENEMLSRHTSWRVGGPVARFYQPADIEDLSVFMAGLSVEEPIYWLGLGSNLLVRDGGYRGTVICTSGVLNGLDVLEQQRIYVEAGVACPKVAKVAANHGLTGAEFLCGIPGTMGGALAMNAGAFGGETWDVVASVQTLDRQGTLHQRTAADYQIGYRQVRGPQDEWFVSCVLQLKSGDSEESQNRIKTLLSKRSASQPTQQANAGSVFRNPPGDYAARLIEACGLKGTCIGGACVSEKHANFIVNTGTASAADIEALITKVQQTVEQETGVRLQTEVRVVGDNK